MKALKPWQKVALVTLTVLATFTFISVIAVFSVLPSPAELGARLRARSRVSNASSSTLATVQASKGPDLSPPIAAVGSLGASPSPTPIPSTEQRRRLINQKFVERYLTDDRLRSQICENLSQATAPFRNSTEFGQQIETSLLNGTTLPPATEAVMLPVEYTLKNDAVRDLVRAAQNAADRGDTSFVGKAQFYAQAASATASIYNSRAELEAISGHAYRLYALSRAVALKPQLLQDPEASSLCRAIERAAIDNVPFDEADDRERLMQLLSRHGIDPESINYDPALSSGIQVKAEASAFEVNIPWLDRIFQRR